MKYRQLGQTWTSATCVNLVLLGLLMAIAVLYLCVLTYEVCCHVRSYLCRMRKGHRNVSAVRHPSYGNKRL